jgi:hypothetical protein
MQLIGASFVTSLTLFAGLTGSAAAQTQDGLINVMVGDVTILEDVNIAVAAQVAAAICGVKVGPVAVLGTAVDRSSTDRVVCTPGTGDIRLTQN